MTINECSGSSVTVFLLSLEGTLVLNSEQSQYSRSYKYHFNISECTITLSTNDAVNCREDTRFQWWYKQMNYRYLSNQKELCYIRTNLHHRWKQLVIPLFTICNRYKKTFTNSLKNTRNVGHRIGHRIGRANHRDSKTKFCDLANKAGC